MIKNFKISVKELFIIVCISLPIGIYIFASNKNKISYEMYVFGGNNIAINFCNNYQSGLNLPAIDKNKFYSISSEINTLNVSKNNNYKMVLEYDGNNQKYRLMFTGYSDSILKYKSFGDEIFERLLESESNYQKNINEKITLYCNSRSLIVFKPLPSDKEYIYLPPKQRYSNFKLFFDATSPLILLYLLMISYKKIRPTLFK